MWRRSKRSWRERKTGRLPVEGKAGSRKHESTKNAGRGRYRSDSFDEAISHTLRSFRQKDINSVPRRGGEQALDFGCRFRRRRGGGIGEFNADFEKHFFEAGRGDKNQHSCFTIGGIAKCMFHA